MAAGIEVQAAAIPRGTVEAQALDEAGVRGVVAVADLEDVAVEGTGGKDGALAAFADDGALEARMEGVN